MINRLRLLICALVLVGWGSCVSPSPAPTPPSPSPSPVPTVVDPGPCADPVACACAVLAAYDCPEGKPTAKGQSCHDVYAPVFTDHLPGWQDTACVAGARTLAQVRGCHVTCSLPGAPASAPLGVVQPSGPGQTTMAHSMSVAVASDQTPLPISGTITATVSNVGQGTANDGGSPWYVQSSTLATSAAQTTANTSLSTIGTNTGPATSIGSCANNSLTDTNAHQFGSLTCSRGCWVSAPLANTAAIYIGHSAVATTTGIELQPGDRAFFGYSNCNILYAITGTATQAAHYCNQ